MDVSIIICCYNSENLIGDTLKHIINQKVSHNLKLEVVLVNNNSTDNTVSKAQEIWEKSGSSHHLNIFHESEPGLSHARKTGVQHAQSDIIIFCDDDNWLDENYVQIAFDFMCNNPNVGALGGQSEGKLEIEEPDWWKDKATGFAVGKQADESGNVNDRGFLWGAGLVIRRVILTTLYEAGFTSLLAGRTGKKVSSGDDSEITKWVLILGYDLWYLEDLKFKHYITAPRLTDAYLIKIFQGHKEATKTLRWYQLFLNISKKEKGDKLSNFLFGTYQFVRGKISNSEHTLALSQMKLGEIFKVHSVTYDILKIYGRCQELINTKRV